MRNLGSKENRLHDLKCQFEYLTKGGYTQEAYKDLNIFTLNKDGMLILKVFRGGGCPPANQIWCVPLIGYPTGGTFTISITTSGTFTTSAMAFNIVPADVQTEIESLSGFSGNVSVTGSRFNHVIEFINDLQHTPITLTADGQDLLGYGIHVPQYQIQVGRA